MKNHETVSTIMSEVRANGSISTKKPSTVTMKIGHRLASAAYGLFLDEQEDKKPETGLIGFELVAIYEDGKPEPEPVEIEIEEDHCENCGILIDDDNYTLTSNDVYLCQKCADELKEESEYENQMSDPSGPEEIEVGEGTDKEFSEMVTDEVETDAN